MSNDTHDNEDKPAPKIIVDSDWKAQVAKEKEASSQTSASKQTSADSGGLSEGAESLEPVSSDVAEKTQPETPAKAEASEKAESPAKAESPEKQPLPPASFDVLVSMLFTQAIMSLGQMPNPEGATTVDKAMAKHSIDMLEMLEAKTKGNLSSDESKMLGEALHALRMAYVSVRG